MSTWRALALAVLLALSGWLLATAALSVPAMVAEAARHWPTETDTQVPTH